MRVPYCCDPKAHEQYYDQQVGRGLPYFAGAHYQRGHGLGSILGGLFRSAIPLVKPLVKQGVRTMGREALKAGVGVVGDVLQGRNIKQSAGRRLKAAAGNTLKRVATDILVPTKPIKRKRTTTKTIPRRKYRRSTNKKQVRDIFSK